MVDAPASSPPAARTNPSLPQVARGTPEGKAKPATPFDKGHPPQAADVTKGKTGSHLKSGAVLSMAYLDKTGHPFISSKEVFERLIKINTNSEYSDKQKDALNRPGIAGGNLV